MVGAAGADGQRSAPAVRPLLVHPARDRPSVHPENSFVIRTEAAQSDFDRFCAQVLDPATDGVPLLTRELSDYRDQLPDGAQELSQAAKHELTRWSRPSTTSWRPSTDRA